MTDEPISFVLLKYEILTSDPNTWYLCDTYPPEVRSKWAWRCAADVEHLAKGHPDAEYFIGMSKKFRDGAISYDELNIAHYNFMIPPDPSTYEPKPDLFETTNPRYATLAAYYASTGRTARAVRRAATSGHAELFIEKWDLYISWLIEELGDWEQTHG